MKWSDCLTLQKTKKTSSSTVSPDWKTFCPTVNLFEIIEGGIYNHLINAIQQYIFVLRSHLVNHPEDTGVSSAYFAPVQHSTSGRPRYGIMYDQLSFLVGENFNTRRIANCLGVSFSTVRRRLRDNGIELDQTYSQISDTDLDQFIRNIRLYFPRIGCRQMRAMLESDHGLRIQRFKVRMAMRRVDPAGASIRWSEVHVRRRYYVYGANALWHIDTHHSLVTVF